MKTEHIPELIIQQYSIAPEDSETAIKSHILSCEQCRQKAEGYKILFGGIKKMKKPQFDVDLVTLILPQIAPRKNSIKLPVMWVFVLIAIIASGLMVYLFSTILSGLLVGLTPIFFWLLTITITGITGFIGIDAYLQFKKKLDQLNYFKNLQH